MPASLPVPALAVSSSQLNSTLLKNVNTGSGASFSDKFVKGVVDGTSQSLLESAVYGTDLTEALKKNLRSQIVKVGTSEILTHAVKPIDADTLSRNIAHKLAAALTGCISATANKQDCEAGAIGAAVGEMWGDWRVDAETQKLIDAGILSEGTDAYHQIVNQSKLIAGIVAALAEKDVNVAAGMAEEAVRWNGLAESLLSKFHSAYTQCQDSRCKEKVIHEYAKKSEYYDNLMTSECTKNSSGSACANLIRLSLNYAGDSLPFKPLANKEEANQLILKNLNQDIKRSRKVVLGLVLSNEDLFHNINTIESRADFFDAMSKQFPNARWFAGASEVSRRCLSGLGASGCPLHSNATFLIGSSVSWNTSGTAWRREAGAALMQNGYQDFKALWEGRVSDYRQWDIKRLVEEQTILQPIHEKHIKGSWIFTLPPKLIGTGIWKSKYDEFTRQNTLWLSDDGI